jgi:hypothetical protein
MVRWPSIDAYIITAEWYAGLTSMVTSSPLDGTSDWHRWTHHHRRMV